MTEPGRHEQETSGEERLYSLDELTELAGVTIRTVRYYIAEGLLPPPTSNGPRSAYSNVHLNRLLLISRLKDAYLPLKEIRRQLQGMTDEEIAGAVASTSVIPASINELTMPLSGTPQPAPKQAQAFTAASRDSAASYIDRVLNETERPRRSRSRPPQTPMPIGRVDLPGVFPPDFPGGSSPSWKRLPITPEAELLIEDEAYQRRRDQIDAAVDWIRRILNS